MNQLRKLQDKAVSNLREIETELAFKRGELAGLLTGLSVIKAEEKMARREAKRLRQASIPVTPIIDGVPVLPDGWGRL